MLVCCYALPLLSSCLLICVFVYCLFSRLGPASCDVNPLLSRLSIEYVPTPKAVTRAKLLFMRKANAEAAKLKMAGEVTKGLTESEDQESAAGSPNQKSHVRQKPLPPYLQ